MSACSDPGKPSPPPRRAGVDRPAWAEEVGPATLRRSVRATTSVTSGRVELRTALTGLAGAPGAPEGVEEVGMVHRATFDRTAGRAAVETDMSDLAAVTDGDLAGGAGSGDYSRPLRMVVDGDSVYTQMGPLAESLGLEPSSWIRRDLDSMVAEGVDSETAALLLAPLGTLEVLLTPARDVAVAGDGRIDDAPVVHLRATLDLSQARRDGTRPAGPETFQGRLRAAGVDELPVEVWLDEDQVLRRLVVRLDPGLAGGSGPEGLATTFELHAPGADVEIAPPAAAEVVEAADLRRAR